MLILRKISFRKEENVELGEGCQTSRHNKFWVLNIIHNFINNIQSLGQSMKTI